MHCCKCWKCLLLQVDIDLIDPDGVFQLKAANGTNAIMADDEEEGKQYFRYKVLFLYQLPYT